MGIGFVSGDSDEYKKVAEQAGMNLRDIVMIKRGDIQYPEELALAALPKDASSAKAIYDKFFSYWGDYAQSFRIESPKVDKPEDIPWVEYTRGHIRPNDVFNRMEIGTDTPLEEIERRCEELNKLFASKEFKEEHNMNNREHITNFIQVNIKMKTLTLVSG